jgi:hypothetical protein
MADPSPARRPVLLLGFTAAFVLAVVAAFLFVPALQPTPADPSLEVASRFRPHRSAGVVETGTAFDVARLELAGASELRFRHPNAAGLSLGGAGGLTYRFEPDDALTGRADVYLRKAVRAEENNSYSFGTVGLQISAVRHQIQVWRLDQGRSAAVVVWSTGQYPEGGVWVTATVRHPRGVTVRLADQWDTTFHTFTPTNPAARTLNEWREVKQSPVPKDEFPK